MAKNLEKDELQKEFFKSGILKTWFAFATLIVTIITLLSKCECNFLRNLKLENKNIIEEKISEHISEKLESFAHVPLWKYIDYEQQDNYIYFLDDSIRSIVRLNIPDISIEQPDSVTRADYKNGVLWKGEVKLHNYILTELDTRLTINKDSIIWKLWEDASFYSKHYIKIYRDTLIMKPEYEFPSKLRTDIQVIEPNYDTIVIRTEELSSDLKRLNMLSKRKKEVDEEALLQTLIINSRTSYSKHFSD